MIVKSAEFLQSKTTYQECPPPIHGEFAFIGRSNVGKSSLINMIAGRTKLALTSGTPGKTQTINHFLLNKNLYLADLPGYGYAKVSKKDRKKWESMIRDYLLFRPNLVTTFILVDMRVPPQASDLEFMEWMGISQLPFVIVFTKSDKLTKNELAKNLQTYQAKLHETWDELPVQVVTSSVSKTGKDEILDYMEQNAGTFRKG